MTWLHYSRQPKKILPDHFFTQEPQLAEYTKPKGIWITPDTEDNWFNWCLEEEFQWHHLVHEYELELELKEILQISDADSLQEFHRIYHWKKDVFRYGIDWSKVTKEYLGIIISPYQFEFRLAPEYAWYYGWDCASGCIWDTAAIKKYWLRKVWDNEELEFARQNREVDTSRKV